MSEFGHPSKVLHIYRNVVELDSRGAPPVEQIAMRLERQFQDLVSDFRAATCAQTLWRGPGLRNRVHARICSSSSSKIARGELGSVVNSDVISDDQKSDDGICTHTMPSEHAKWVAHRIDVKPPCREVADRLACLWRQSKRCGGSTMSESCMMTRTSSPKRKIGQINVFL